MRKIGWMYECDHLRPLYWKEYQYWLKCPLPFGWSIIVAPEQDADATDYAELLKISR
jgi:hypothetical protein